MIQVNTETDYRKITAELDKDKGLLYLSVESAKFIASRFTISADQYGELQISWNSLSGSKGDYNTKHILGFRLITPRGRTLFNSIAKWADVISVGNLHGHPTDKIPDVIDFGVTKNIFRKPTILYGERLETTLKASSVQAALRNSSEIGHEAIVKRSTAYLKFHIEEKLHRWKLSSAPLVDRKIAYDQYGFGVQLWEQHPASLVEKIQRWQNKILRLLTSAS
ncbi:hypothetical protein EVAR_72360_1, partial [Eumeta japonica]